jgi:DNA polymerase-3 subunit alpha
VAATLKREKEQGQSSLFGDATDDASVAVVSPPMPSVPAWAPRDRGVHEKEVLGFYFSEHPLEPLREQLARIATHGIAAAAELPDTTEVRIAAIVGDLRKITTRTGKIMAGVWLEDLTGRIECTVFPDTFEASRALLEPDTIVVATARVEKRDERPARLLISEVHAFDDARTVYRRALHLELRAEELSEDRLADIDRLLSEHPGESDVYLHIVRPDHSRVAMRSRRFRVAEDDAVALVLRERHPSVRVRWGRGA